MQACAAGQVKEPVVPDPEVEDALRRTAETRSRSPSLSGRTSLLSRTMQMGLGFSMLGGAMAVQISIWPE
jgi:hypothetical protein